MELKADEWKLLGVVTEGEPLSIEGCEVWLGKWNRLKLGTVEVPHPSYPSQRHELWPYFMDEDGKTVLFLAGELSNGVWSFYVPAHGQPAERCKGMTVLERLTMLGLLEAFDLAVGERDESNASALLIAAGLNPVQASESVAAIFAEPKKYGYK